MSRNEDRTNGSPIWATAFIDAVAKGIPVKHAARAAGASGTTIYRGLRHDPALAKAFEDAKRRAPKNHSKAAALALRASEFERDGFRWMWANLVSEKFGFHPTALHYTTGTLTRALNNEAIGRIKQNARLYLRVDQLERLAAFFEGLKKLGRSATKPFVERGVRWCPPAWLESEEAHKEGLGFRRHLVNQWSRRKVGWLDNKSVVPREEYAKCADGIFRWVKFYREKDLLDIKAEQQRSRDDKPIGLAEAKRLGFGQCFIERAVREGHLEKVPQLVKTRSHGGFTMKRRPTYSLQRLRALKAGEFIRKPDPKTWATADDVEQILGVTPSSFFRWATVSPNGGRRSGGKRRRKGKRGYRGINGDILPLRTCWNLELRGTKRKRLVYVLYFMRKDAEDIAEVRKRLAAEPYVDPSGKRWFRLGALAKANELAYTGLWQRLHIRTPPQGDKWDVQEVPGLDRPAMAIGEQHVAALLAASRPILRDEKTGRILSFKTAGDESRNGDRNSNSQRPGKTSTPENVEPRQLIVHSDAVAMLRLGNITAKEESRIMERIRRTAGDQLHFEKAGNRYKYELPHWRRVVSVIHNLRPRGITDDARAVERFTDPDPDEIARLKRQILAQRA